MDVRYFVIFIIFFLSLHFYIVWFSTAWVSDITQNLPEWVSEWESECSTERVRMWKRECFKSNNNNNKKCCVCAFNLTHINLRIFAEYFAWISLTVTNKIPWMRLRCTLNAVMYTCTWASNTNGDKKKMRKRQRARIAKS